MMTLCPSFCPFYLWFGNNNIIFEPHAPSLSESVQRQLAMNNMVRNTALRIVVFTDWSQEVRTSFSATIFWLVWILYWNSYDEAQVSLVQPNINPLLV